jgi:hypothetical protein
LFVFFVCVLFVLFIVWLGGSFCSIFGCVLFWGVDVG